MVSTIILSVRYFKNRDIKFKIIASVLWPITFAVCVYVGVLSYFPYQIFNVVKIISMIKAKKQPSDSDSVTKE